MNIEYSALAIVKSNFGALILALGPNKHYLQIKTVEV